MRKQILHILILVSLFASSLFAQDLGQPSKKELYLRARDVLQTALENKDNEKAGQAFSYLQENINEGAPLSIFEEYLIEMEMGRYDEGIRNYAHQRRILLDSSYTKNATNRITEEDGLHKYLFDKFKGFSKAKADSMVNLVDSSNASQESKDLYATLIYAELVVNTRIVTIYSKAYLVNEVGDTTCAEDFLRRAHKFVDSFPNSEHNGYIKNSILPLVERYMERMREFRADPFKHKYYSGSTSLFVGKWLGLMSGDINKHLDTKMGNSWLFDGSFQLWRISVGFVYGYGAINIAKKDIYETDYYENTDDFFGITAGFDVFDSRYLKVEPFIGFGSYFFNNGWDDVNASTFMWGGNIDVRLYATTPRRIGDISTAFLLRFKYLGQLGTFKDVLHIKEPDYYQSSSFKCSDSFVSQTFGLSIGVSLW